MSTRHGPKLAGRWLLAAILTLGLGLRTGYILLVPVTHDEYASLWAARHVWTHGIPQLPSGFVYWQGWLFTYLAAPMELLFHPPAWLMRLPALLAGLASIVLVYRLGLALAGRGAGIIAAFGWALTPIAIVAGGQARMYAFLDLFSLLAMLFLLRWMRHERAVDGWAFAVATLGALASQTVALLILPGLATVALVAKGWRWWAKPTRWPPWIVCGAGAGAALLLNRVGGPVASAARRPYLAVGWPWQKIGLTIMLREWLREWLRDPQGWLIAIALLASLLLMVTDRRERWRGPLTILHAAWLPGLLIFAVAIGETWQRLRYVQMLLPFTLLVAAIVLWRAVERWGHGILTLGVATVLAALWLAPAVTVLRTPELDHQAAYGYIQGHRPANGSREVVLTGLPVVAGYFLGHADGYVLQRDFQEYVVLRGGELVDRWTGAPLLASAWAVGGALTDAEGAWFVVSAERLPMLYRPDFAAYLSEIMEPVFQQGGLIVYYTKDGFQPAIRGARPATWTTVFGEDQPARVSLIGYELHAQTLEPSDTLQVALHWQADRRLVRDLTAFVHVLDEGGDRVAQADHAPADGILTTRWPVGQAVRGRFTIALPADLATGEYRLLVGLYDPDTLERLPLEGSSPDNALVLTSVQLGK